MAKHKKSAKVNMPMCLASILFCFTLISINITSGLYARYVATSSGGDQARVAKFYITEDNTHFSEDMLISLAPGTIETTITVVNQSETAVNYTITVKNKTNNIPLQFRIGNQLTDTRTYGLAPHSGEDTYTLQIVWDEEGALEHMGKVDIVTITLDAVQID